MKKLVLLGAVVLGFTTAMPTEVLAQCGSRSGFQKIGGECPTEFAAWNSWVIQDEMTDEWKVTSVLVPTNWDSVRNGYADGFALHFVTKCTDAPLDVISMVGYHNSYVDVRDHTITFRIGSNTAVTEEWMFVDATSIGSTASSLLVSLSNTEEETVKVRVNASSTSLTQEFNITGIKNVVDRIEQTCGITPTEN